jgi:hypothetical protein
LAGTAAGGLSLAAKAPGTFPTFARLGKIGLGNVSIPRSASANFSLKQLAKKWKHASDFGINTTKRNPTTLAHYQKAIACHLDDVATIEKGTYIYVKDSKVFFNPNTNVAVVLDRNGAFVTGFRLNPGTPQCTNLLKNGVLR